MSPRKRPAFERFGIFMVFFLLASCQRKDALPPVVEALPEFSLPAVTLREEKTLQKKDLEGRVWIAGFIFTSCSGPCPRISKNMEKLQSALPPEVGLLTFSIDPERDTPSTLQSYAKQFNADPARWWFVTGPKADLYALFENGFKVVAAEDKALPLSERFVHSTKLVLLDKTSQIRGYYDGEQRDALFRLKRDAEKLLLPSVGKN